MSALCSSYPVEIFMIVLHILQFNLHKIKFIFSVHKPPFSSCSPDWLTIAGDLFLNQYSIPTMPFAMSPCAISYNIPNGPLRWIMIPILQKRKWSHQKNTRLMICGAGIPMTSWETITFLYQPKGNTYRVRWAYSVSTEGRTGTMNRSYVNIDFSQLIKGFLKKQYYRADTSFLKQCWLLTLDCCRKIFWIEEKFRLHKLLNFTTE